jgi:hypothetical protein
MDGCSPQIFLRGLDFRRDMDVAPVQPSQGWLLA